MDVVGNAIRNLNDPNFKVKTILKSEWISEEERLGMQDEMKSRIRLNNLYRARSARSIENQILM